MNNIDLVDIIGITLFFVWLMLSVPAYFIARRSLLVGAGFIAILWAAYGVILYVFGDLALGDSVGTGFFAVLPAAIGASLGYFGRRGNNQASAV